jgi:hypothetical protein
LLFSRGRDCKVVLSSTTKRSLLWEGIIYPYSGSRRKKYLKK